MCIVPLANTLFLQLSARNVRPDTIARLVISLLSCVHLVLSRLAGTVPVLRVQRGRIRIQAAAVALVATLNSPRDSYRALVLASVSCKAMCFSQPFARCASA